MFILQLVIVNVVIFLALVFILRRLLAQHATNTTAHLQGLSQEYLKKHDELKKRLEEGERHYQEQLAKAQSEAQQIKTRVIQEAETSKQQLLDQARQEGERIIQQAIHARDTLTKELTQAVETRALERACELIQDVLPRQLRQDTHAQWLEDLIRNGLIPEGKLGTREDVREVRIVSAFPLTTTHRQQLLECLQAALGHPVTLHEAVEPRIIAGLVVTIGHVVLDGSLASKLREAARHAQDSAR